MKQEDDDKRNYSFDDITRYLSGGMSAREMYAFEKAALDDPFLADAIEGYQKTNNTSATSAMDLLRGRLRERVEPKKKRLTIPVIKVGIAALLFLVAGSLSILFFINRSEQQNRQVLVEERAPAPQKNITPSQPADSSVSANMIVKAERKQARVYKQEAPKLTLRDVERPATSTEEFSFDTLRDSESKEDNLVVRPAAASPPKNVLLEKTSAGSMQKSAPTAMSRSASPIEPSLPHITPYGLSANEAGFEPVRGWSNYNIYLHENQKLSPTLLDTRATVVIEFTVASDSSAGNVKVVKTGSPIFDAEAIRLVKEGPRWLLKKDGISSVSVTIRF